MAMMYSSGSGLSSQPVGNVALRPSTNRSQKSEKFRACQFDGIIPDRIVEYTYYPRTLVIGDAAGFVNRMNYEGIYYARKSGKIAAEVILKAIERKNFTAAYLGRYEKKWYREIYLPYLLDSRLAHHFYYHSS